MDEDAVAEARLYKSYLGAVINLYSLWSEDGCFTFPDGCTFFREDFDGFWI